MTDTPSRLTFSCRVRGSMLRLIAAALLLSTAGPAQGQEGRLQIHCSGMEANWVGVRPAASDTPFVRVATQTPAWLTFPLADVPKARTYDIRVEYRGWLFRYADEKRDRSPRFDTEMSAFHLRYDGVDPVGVTVLVLALAAVFIAFRLLGRRTRHLERRLAQVEREKEILASTKGVDGEAPNLLGRTLETQHGRTFEVLRVVGKGNMGAVFEAVARDGDEEGEAWAIKVPFREVVVQEDSRRRFLREAEICNRLSHVGLVQVLDWGTFEAPDESDIAAWPFIVMELMNGRTLRDLIEQDGSSGLPWQRVPPMVAELALALQQMHAASVVHRDLKPDNIFLTASGHLKIGDFGLSGRVDRHSLTLSGESFGTPLYMSPEHLEAQTTTGASDIYSLGVITYELLCGTPPFMADTSIAVLNRMMHEKAPPVRHQRPDVPRELDWLVADMLSRDAAHRPTPAEIVGRLDEIENSSATRIEGDR